jgi:putative transposase
MTEITTLLTYLHPLLTSTHYRQLIIISEALLTMTGRITPLSISHWTGKKTHGLGRFFSSLYSRAVPRIAFQTLSLFIVNVSQALLATSANKSIFDLKAHYQEL